MSKCPATTEDGVCGATVRASADRPLIVCPRCGTKGDAAAWRRMLKVAAPPDSGNGTAGERVATSAQIAAWLSHLHNREITATVVRMWAAYPVKRVGGLQLPRVGKDSRGATLHPVDVAERIAEGLYSRESA